MPTQYIIWCRLNNLSNMNNFRFETFPNCTIAQSMMYKYQSQFMDHRFNLLFYLLKWSLFCWPNASSGNCARKKIRKSVTVIKVSTIITIILLRRKLWLICPAWKVATGSPPRCRTQSKTRKSAKSQFPIFLQRFMFSWWRWFSSMNSKCVSRIIFDHWQDDWIKTVVK